MKIPTNEFSPSIDDQTEELLNRLPVPLQQRWAADAEKLPSSDALALLKKRLSDRENAKRFPKTVTPLIPEEKVIASFTEDVNVPVMDVLQNILEQEGQLLGEGRVARVYMHPSNPRICYKVVHDYTQYALCNNVLQEGEFLNSLGDFTHKDIRTPQVYYFITLPTLTAIVMERLPGKSLEQIMDDNVLPDTFDVKRYFTDMHDYFEVLFNERHTYHRDIRSGNLMFDPESGSKFVIDFGKAVRAFPDESDLIEFKFGNKLYTTRDTSHEELRRVEHEFRNHFSV